MKTAVAFLVFNRPDCTARVFERIREARPPRLLVVADGPRAGRAGEAERCDAVRRVIDGVDWDCEVLRHYADVNLGCKRRISSGLDWVFAQAEEAIILEDDCLPDPTFFRFCEEMLERHRADKRVMGVTGTDFQFSGRTGSRYSYTYSRYCNIWGWATWRRAWALYDVEMKLWPEVRDGGWLQDALGDRRAVRFFSHHLQETYAGRIDTWDYQWALALWANSGLTVVPSVNLVRNVGFGAGATHTGAAGAGADVPTEPIGFPLRHPPLMIHDDQGDRMKARRGRLGALARRILRAAGVPFRPAAGARAGGPAGDAGGGGRVVEARPRGAMETGS